MGYVIGIDYSMTCPAACAYAPEDVQFWFAHERTCDALPTLTRDPVSDKSSVSLRAWDHATLLLRWLQHRDFGAAITIEDYAFAATGRVFHIGEHTGILKHALDQHGIAIHAVPPTVIKKFATGKGNADKDKMVRAFIEAHPIAATWIPTFFPRSKGVTPAKSPLGDLADAYWIARYSKEHPNAHP